MTEVPEQTVEQPDPDAAVPAHRGDPLAEQRAMARSAAVVDRSHRGVIAVPGEERLSWLHLLLSQHVSELPEGAGTEALILDALDRLLRAGRHTAFVIAQRLSTVRDADLVLVVDDGRIAAQGTHEELLAESELYNEILGSQLQAERPADALPVGEGN